MTALEEMRDDRQRPHFISDEALAACFDQMFLMAVDCFCPERVTDSDLEDIVSGELVATERQAELMARELIALRNKTEPTT